MVNPSKLRSRKYWKKLEASGAVGTIEDAQSRIRPEHRRILNKIRNLYVQSGGKSLSKPEHWGCNPFFKSKTGGLEINFSYGIPDELYTPVGAYIIIGDRGSGNREKFWELFIEAFNVEILESEGRQRPDSKNRLEYQFTKNGPYVRISEKTDA